MKCKNCRWFDNIHESLKLVPNLEGKYSIGYCRKHKPMVYGKGAYYYSGWPVVDVDDYCGEFRKKEE